MVTAGDRTGRPIRRTIPAVETRRRAQPAPDHGTVLHVARARAHPHRVPGSSRCWPCVAAWAVSAADAPRSTRRWAATRRAFLAFDGTVRPRRAQVLSTIAGSTLTFTGIVFSITAVALQLGSSQFSPRALRNFLRDRGTQWTLGAAGRHVHLLAADPALRRPRADRRRRPRPVVSAGPGPRDLGRWSAFVVLRQPPRPVDPGGVDHRARGERDTGRPCARRSRRRSRARRAAARPAARPDRHLGAGAGRDPGLRRGRPGRLSPGRRAWCCGSSHRIGDYVPSGAPAVEVWRIDDRRTARRRPAANCELLRAHRRGASSAPWPRTRVRLPAARRHRREGAVARGQRPDDRGAGDRPPPRPVAAHRHRSRSPRASSVDAGGAPRLVVPVPRWERPRRTSPATRSATTAPRRCQVARRHAGHARRPAHRRQPEHRRPVLHHQLGLLDARGRPAFADPDDRAWPARADYQGIGA